MGRIKKRADGRYAVSIVVGRKDGKPIRKFFYGTSSGEAKRLRDEWMNRHEYGGNGVPTERIDGSITLDEWTDKWLQSYKSNLAPNTRDHYYYTAKSFRDFEKDGIRYGDLAVSAFKPLHLTAYIMTLAGCSKSKIRSASMTIQQIFDSAKTNGLIGRDVCADIRDTLSGLHVRGSYEGHKALDREMIDLICSTYSKHRAGLFIMTIMFAGLRPGEAAGLRWEDVDFENGVLHVRRSRDLKHDEVKTAKTEAGNRDVPLFLPLAKAYAAARQPSGYICTDTDGKPLNDNTYDRAFISFRNFLERTLNGVPDAQNRIGFRSDRWAAQHPGVEWKTLDFTPYDLRDTFATTLYDAGVDVLSMQQMMGHRDVTTTLKIYTKLSKERQKDSAAQMDEFLAKTYAL